MKPTKFIALIAAVAALYSAQPSAQEYYRYRDENGVMRMDISIPGQYVDQGYDVLNAQGMLIRRVPPRQPSAAGDSADQQAEDNILLSSYSSEADITAHRDRRLEGIQRQIDILMSDRRVIAGELDKEIRAASGYRAEGNPVPAEISSRIDELDVMVRNLDQQMIQRAEEKQAITDEFAAKVARFNELRPQQN